MGDYKKQEFLEISDKATFVFAIQFSLTTDQSFSSRLLIQVTFQRYLSKRILY
jgi:hypothetical protein